MKSKILILIILGLGIIGTAYAAPNLIYQKSILPITDGIYDLGTTTAKWNRVITNNLDATNGTIGTLTLTSQMAAGDLLVNGQGKFGTTATTTISGNSGTSAFSGNLT